MAQMSQEQAMNILTTNCVKVNETRENHAIIQQAVQSVKGYIFGGVDKIPMEPLDAIKIVDKALGSLKAPLESHNEFTVALKVLAEAIASDGAEPAEIAPPELQQMPPLQTNQHRMPQQPQQPRRGPGGFQLPTR
jgi:hypothetical protein